MQWSPEASTELQRLPHPVTLKWAAKLPGNPQSRPSAFIGNGLWMKLSIWQCHEVVSPLVLRQNQYQSCFLPQLLSVEKFQWLKHRTLENLFGNGLASNRKIYTIAATGVFALKCNAFVTYATDVTTSNMAMPLHCTESSFVYDVCYPNEW